LCRSAIELLWSGGFGGESNDSVENGVRTLRTIDTRPPVKSISGQVRNILEELIEREPVDTVEFPECESLGLDFQRANPDFPVVVKLHGDSEMCLVGDAPKWKRIAYRLYKREAARLAVARERETVARAHFVVSPSQWLLNSCLHRKFKISSGSLVVPNPFSGWPVSDGAIENSFITSIPNPLCILWLARLDRRKGADLLPAIARIVWQSVPEAEFHIIGQQVGKRPWIDWIQEQVPKRHRAQIVYVGGLPYAEVGGRISSYSMAVFASVWENFPYTELECMWEGLACVSASGGGPAELGLNGVSHLRAERSPKKIAESLIKLLRDERLRSRIGQVARNSARSEFNAENVAAQMPEVYEVSRRLASNRERFL